MKRKLPLYPALFVLGFILLCTYIWFSTSRTDEPYKKHKRDNVIGVTVIQPQIKAMPVMLEAVGTLQAHNMVSIVPQVGGVLKKIYFEEGAQVTQGELLFEIDAGLFSAELDQAKANLQRDQAQLAALKADADRYAALAKLEYVTRQQAEKAQAASAAQVAVVESDVALVRQAEIQYGFTQVRAPIAGKISHITVHVGDLITANSATPLVVINQLNPMEVDFSIPQVDLAKIQNYQKLGTLKVMVRDQENGKLLSEGKQLSINNTADNQTGTVQLKAQVENKDGSLWPGTFVTVELILTVEPKALVIPDSALQMGQKGHYVYAVRDGKAVVQLVEIAREVKQEAVIASGLTQKDAIIGEVPSGLSEGKAVEIIPSK